MKISSDLLVPVIIASDAALRAAPRIDAGAPLNTLSQQQKPSLFSPVVNDSEKDELLTKLDEFGAKRQSLPPNSFASRFEEAYTGADRDRQLDELHHLLGIDEFA